MGINKSISAAKKASKTKVSNYIKSAKKSVSKPKVK